MKLKMSTNDWNDFNKDISWFIKPTDKVTLSETFQGKNIFRFSDSFINLYPVLSELLMKARVTNVQVNDEIFQLLGWSDQEERSKLAIKFEFSIDS